MSEVSVSVEKSPGSGIVQNTSSTQAHDRSTLGFTTGSSAFGSSDRPLPSRESSGLPMNEIPACVSPPSPSLPTNTLAENAQCFTFSYSPSAKCLVSWSGNSLAVLGTETSVILRDGNLFLRHVHPDDRFYVLSALEASLSGQAAYQVTYRWIRPDRNEVRWLQARATLHEGVANGTAPQNASASGLLSGLIFDITADVSATAPRINNTPQFSFNSLSEFSPLYFTIDNDLRLAQISRPGDTHQRLRPESLKAAEYEENKKRRRESSNPGASTIEIDQVDFGDPLFSTDLFQVGRPVLAAFGTETLRFQYARVFEQILAGTLPIFRTRLSHMHPPIALELVPWRAAAQSGSGLAGADELRSGEIVGIFGVAEDCSALADLERQVIDLRRADGLRALASGVSHHVNNVLQGIVGQATLIESHPADQDAVVREARSIGELVQRASELMQQLFLFDDASTGALAPVDLNLSVMAAVSAVEDFFASPSEIQVGFGNPLPILARQQSIVEIIREVLRLALEHSNTFDPGKSALEIRTRHVVHGADSNSAQSRSIDEPGRTKSGAYSQLLVTKKQQPGVPLPPPMSRVKSLHVLTSNPTYRKTQAALERFGGTLSCNISAEDGFSVALTLPAMAPEEDSLVIVDQNAAPEILVVDDDAMVLSTVKRMLEDFGYRCVAAQSGSRARALAHAYARSIKLVLLDAIIPGEDSSSLVSDLRHAIPALVLVGFTGADAERSEHLKQIGLKRIIKKPVDAQVLREVLRSLIEPNSSIGHTGLRHPA